MTVRLPYDEMVTALRLLDEDLGERIGIGSTKLCTKKEVEQQEKP